MEAEAISLKLENLLTRKTYEHALHRQNNKLSILTYHQILERIQLYEPLFNHNKILVQVKVNCIWQYWTTGFSIHLKKCGQTVIEVRYKPFYKKSDLSQLKEDLQQMLDNCSKKLKEYQSKFQTNLLDINILWASPLFFKSQNDKQCRITWSISNQYIKAIYSAIKRSKKRVFSTINFFNFQSLGERDHYEIVYLICHSESKFPCLVGENSDGKGQKLEIFPGKMQQIFKGKSIQLLIIHSSYPYNHLDKIKSCKGIKNVLIIKSNPIYNSDSVYCFFQKFFRFLLTGQTIEKSLREAIKQVQAQFPEDKVCCCYHNHAENCQLNSELKIKNSKYHLGHYLKHKREQQKRQNFCCCPGQSLKQNHELEAKFQFSKCQNPEKQFFFQSGEPQGDIEYLQAFETKQLIIGSNDILRGLLKDYVRSKFFRRGYYYNYSEIKIKTHDTKYFFINIYCNFLIRRKVIKTFRIHKFKDLQHISLQKNKDILHVIICYSQDLQFVEKLKQFTVNLLVVKQFRQESDEKKHIIEPFAQRQCKDYICAQKHLSQGLKQKVSKFFQWVWKDLKYKYIYYPSNFDYDQIMRDISYSNYEPENQEYFKWIDVLIKNNKLRDYLLFILVYSSLQPYQRQSLSLNLHQFQFYKIIQPLCLHSDKFLEYSLKYYSLIFQKYFLQIENENILFSLINCFVIFTQIKKKPQCALYEATSDSNLSLFIFVKDIKKIKTIVSMSDNYLQIFLQKADLYHKLSAALSTITKIISSFYLFNVLSKGNENNKQIDLMNSMLLVISHAIIYRKRYQQIIKYDENCSVEEEEIGELSKRNSEDNFLKKDERMDLSIQTIQYKQINPKIYNQNDFKTRMFPLSRKYLLQLIDKFLAKRNFRKSLAISHTLKLQLLLQIVYQNDKQNEQFPHDKFRSSLSYLEKIALDPKMNDKQRQRIFFHIYMSQIALETRGGRSAIIEQQLSSITNIGSQLQFDRKQRDYNQISSQLLKIIDYIASIDILKSRLWRFISSQTKKANYFSFLQKYEETVCFWNSFNALADKMKNQEERQDAYLKLFELKSKVGELAKNEQLSVYVHRMCQDLYEVISQQLKSLSKKTLILLVSKDDGERFYINYSNVVKKALDERLDAQLFVIKMNMCKQNISILQGGFCQYLLITSSLGESIGKNNSNNERKIKTKKTLEHLLLLQPRYIFYCLSKDFEDIETVCHEARKEKTTLVYYDFKNAKAKLDEALKQACAIVLSIKFLQQKIFQTFQKPEKTIVFSYGKQISENQKFFIKEEEIKKIMFNIGEKNKSFFNCQLKPKNSQQLSSYESIDESQSQNMRQAEQRKIVNFDFKDIIIQGFLQHIKVLKKLPILQNYTVKTHTQKNIQIPLNLDTYIGMVKTYFSSRFEDCKFFQFSDDSEDEKNIYLSQNSKIISFFTSNQFLHAYRSNSNLCIIIKNFKFNRKLGWVSQIIKEILFQLSSTEEQKKYKHSFQSRFIKINDIPCLISLKKNINI